MKTYTQFVESLDKKLGLNSDEHKADEHNQRGAWHEWRGRRHGEQSAEYRRGSALNKAFVASYTRHKNAEVAHGKAEEAFKTNHPDKHKLRRAAFAASKLAHTEYDD